MQVNVYEMVAILSGEDELTGKLPVNMMQKSPESLLCVTGLNSLWPSDTYMHQ